MKKNHRLILVIAVPIVLLFGAQRSPADDYQLYPSEFINFNTFCISYKETDSGPAKIDVAELWFTTDKGKTWAEVKNPKMGHDQNNVPYFEFTAPADGEYGFKVVLIDETHTGESRPVSGENPQRAAIVDTKLPEVKLLNPKPEEGFLGDSEVSLYWECTDENLPENNTLIEASFDNGKTWDVILRNQPAKGMSQYKLPATPNINVLFKVSTMDNAANEGVYVMPKGICIHDAGIGETPRQPAPQQMVLRPPDASNILSTRSISIDYAFTSDQAQDIAEVRLFYTKDEGKNWKLYGSDPDRQSPFAFTAPHDGTFGFYACAYNHIGLPSESEPQPGAVPRISVTIDTVPPVVCILSPQGGEFLPADSHQQISWTAVDKNGLPKNSISLYYSTDNSLWQVIVQDVNNNSSPVDWFTPAMTCNVYLKITARDCAGNTSSYVMKAPVNILSESPGKISLTGFSAVTKEGPAPETHPGTVTPTAPAYPVTADEAARARKLFARGNFFFKQGKYEEARAEYKASTSVNPNQYETFAKLGYVCLKLNAIPDAVEAFKRAEELSPKNPEILYDLAFSANRMEDYDTSARALILLVSSASEDSEILEKALKLLWNVTTEFKAAGETQKAVECRDAMLKAPSNSEYKRKAAELKI